MALLGVSPFSDTYLTGMFGNHTPAMRKECIEPPPQGHPMNVRQYVRDSDTKTLSACPWPSRVCKTQTWSQVVKQDRDGMFQEYYN